MTRPDNEQATREAMEGLGLEYESPLPDIEIRSARYVIWRAVIGYSCWILIMVYFFGGE